MPDPSTPRPARRGFRRWFRRYGVVVLFLAAAGAGWWVAFRELASRRPPDVPFLGTPPEAVGAMVELAEVRDGDVVYDLGCGDGRLVIAAARGRAVRGVGLDIDPERVTQAREAVERAGLADRVTIRRADILWEDLRDATVVMMYLSPYVNEQLIPQFDRLRPGTRIVSYHYRIPGRKPRKMVQPTGKKVIHPVYLWVTPLEPE